MRTALLLLIILLYFGGYGYGQGYLANEERSSLGITMVNRSFHHIHEYSASNPVIEFDQQFHWEKWIVTLSSGLMPEQFTILRNAHFGLRYRSKHPYRSNWLEGGIFYQYTKQSPSISHSGKLSGWTLVGGAHQKLSNWFTHEGQAALGFHRGYAIDLHDFEPEEYNALEVSRYDFSYMLLNLMYTGEIELNPFLLGARVQYLSSHYTKEAYLSLYLEKNVGLSSGQLFQIGGGATLTCFREYQTVISRDEYLQSFQDGVSNINIESFSPVQVFVNLKMMFLRGNKQRAF